MPVVKFSKSFRWTYRNGQAEYDFEGGKTYRGVTKEAAAKAVEKGVGEIVSEEGGDEGESPTVETPMA